MLKSNVVLIRWNRTVVGREQKAVDFFRKTMETYAKWQASGRIKSFDAIILSPHSGDMNGFVLIHGDGDALTALRQDDEFMSLVYQSGHFLEGFGVIEGYTGEVLMGGMKAWDAEIAGLK